jgi:hypothetical protein
MSSEHHSFVQYVGRSNYQCVYLLVLKSSNHFCACHVNIFVKSTCSLGPATPSIPYYLAYYIHPVFSISLASSHSNTFFSLPIHHYLSLSLSSLFLCTHLFFRERANAPIFFTPLYTYPGSGYQVNWDGGSTPVWPQSLVKRK